MRKKIYQLLLVSERKGDLSWWVDLFLVSLITTNVLAIVLESIESMQKSYQVYFSGFEQFSVAVFTIEYLLRVWTADLNEKFKGRINFLFTPMAVIDLLAILPFYLSFLGVDFRFLRMIRLFRLFRLFKIVRYMKALRLIRNVFKEKKEELALTIVFSFIMLIVTSILMYFIEHKAQPDAFSSIPETMWWGIATLTTVGYGDLYPITPIGKLLGGFIAVLGIGLFALPTGILASGFSEQLSSSKKTKTSCTHCGLKLNEESLN